jgi:signal transduction histidine kinase
MQHPFAKQSYEFQIALLISWIRLGLAATSPFVVLLDRSIPDWRSVLPTTMLSAVLMILYAVIMLMITYHRQSTPKLAPYLDVLMATVLIGYTYLYLSPFNLWFVFGVLAAAVTQGFRSSLLVAAFVVVINGFLGLIAHNGPVDFASYMARTGYRAGFSVLLAALVSGVNTVSKRVSNLEFRARVSDELHDTVLQTLASVSLHAEAAMDTEDVERTHHLQTIQELSRSEFRRIRHLLDREDWEPEISTPDTLEQVAADRWKGEFQIDIDPSIQLTEARWRALSSALKEGLNNARVHGNAKSAHVKLVHVDERVRFTLAADGEPPTEPIEPGYGLSRLRHWVEANGGHLELTKGESGTGSLLTIEFPS